MKKILSIAFAALLVLGFAASAFAIHAEIPAETQAVVAKGSTQISLGGELRIRGWYRHNLGTEGFNTATAGTDAAAGWAMLTQEEKNLIGGVFTLGTVSRDAAGNVTNISASVPLGHKHQSAAWYDYRVRLHVDAKVSPNLQGFVQLETSGTNFDNTNDKYTFGTSAGNSAFSNAHPTSELLLLQAWMLYHGTGLFGFDSGIKIGHMPLALGEKQFYDHTQMGDDAIVFYMNPTKAVHIGLLTIKLSEGSTADNTNDLDAYVGLMTYKINDNHTVGINYTYVNLSDGLVVPPVGDENHTGIKLHNVGLHANGNIGNFGYNVEGDIQFGHQDNYLDCDTDPVTLVTTCTTDNKYKYRGWALFVKANYKINTVNLRGMFAYGSGDNDASDNKIKEFVPFVGNVQNYSFIYEYQHTTAAANVSGLNPAAPSNGHAAGIANTTVYNLGVDWQAMKELGLSLDGYIFRASKVGYIEDIVGDDVSHSAGWEIDAKAKYQITKGLAYQFDLGYFKPGGFYEDTYGIHKKGVTVARHILTLSF